MLTADENNTITPPGITLSNGQKATLNIEGAQNLQENGVYLFKLRSRR